MAIKVTLSSNTTTPTLQEDNSLKLSRTTYRFLGSLVRNKTIYQTYTDRALPPEVLHVLDELDKLHKYKNYNEEYTGEVPDEAVIKLDEYLGSLGVDEEYPYSEDIQDIPLWLDIFVTSDIRELMQLTTGDILVDSDGNILARIKE